MHRLIAGFEWDPIIDLGDSSLLARHPHADPVPITLSLIKQYPVPYPTPKRDIPHFNHWAERIPFRHAGPPGGRITAPVDRSSSRVLEYGPDLKPDSRPGTPHPELEGLPPILPRKRFVGFRPEPCVPRSQVGMSILGSH